MDLSQLLGEIDQGGEQQSGDASAPDLLKDIEQFTKEQQSGADRPPEGATGAPQSPAEAAPTPAPAFSTLTRQPMLGVEAVATTTEAPPAQELPVKSEIKEPASKTETIQYANGTRYIGELRGGKPHGKGCIYYSNGSHYEGAFDQGEKSGFGVHEWTNTVRYEGQWRAGKKEGDGVIVFPDGSRLQATFRDDECVQGQLWKDGALKHSGPCDSVFIHAPPSSSSSSLHINFTVPLEDDSLRLVYQRLRLLNKPETKASFFYFIKSISSKLAANNDKRASGAIQSFLKETWPCSKQSGMAYRILCAGEDPAYGFSAASPLADVPSSSTQLELLQQSSQYQVLTNSITWVLYNVARSWFEQRAVPRVVLVDLSAAIGSAVRAKTEDDEIALLEGYLPASSVLSSYSFSRATPLLQRLLAVRGILASPINFGSYVDWVSAVEKAFKPAELRELMLQASRR